MDNQLSIYISSLANSSNPDQRAPKTRCFEIGVLTQCLYLNVEPPLEVVVVREAHGHLVEDGADLSPVLQIHLQQLLTSLLREPQRHDRVLEVNLTDLKHRLSNFTPSPLKKLSSDFIVWFNFQSASKSPKVG